MSLQTEFPFTLPRGYVDEGGTLHREGVMRLATARDEIEPLRDARVKENEAYLTVIVLSRTIVKLGSLSQVTPKTVEGLFSSDLAYLQDFYTRINFGGAAEQAAVLDEVQAGAAYSAFESGQVPVPLAAAAAGA
ncbi:MAG: phage tail assembly protein [Dehalococcoidia bacterium]|nr:phage tail assembly protein [Dehalococcoidia bacterium]